MYDSSYQLPPAESRMRDHAGYVASLKKHKPDLTGMPFLEKDCQLPLSRAKQFGEQARFMREMLDDFADVKLDKKKTDQNRKALFQPGRYYGENSKHFDASGQAEWVAPMQQLMMAEKKELRSMLVANLAEVAGPEATAALARRALLDLDAHNRKVALQALKVRSIEFDVGALLVDGLRYPMPAIAQNAAHALSFLERADLVPRLVDMLDAAPPDAPFLEGGTWKVRELVRINHRRNCLLCHPPSDNR